MRGQSIWTAAIGGLVLLCTGASAQPAPSVIQPVSRVAAVTAGSIQGVVLDEKGQPVGGAMVSALGATSAYAVTDRSGRFELRTLTPGPYLVRAHMSGYVAPRGQIIEVRPAAKTASSIALRKALSSGDDPAAYPVLAAGLGPAGDVSLVSSADPSSGSADDHGETAWRLKHSRKSVLKDATVPESLLADSGQPAEPGFGGGFVSHAFGTPGRMAGSLFDAEFSGQVNLLTAGSFDSPQQMFSAPALANGVAYVALGAPVGNHGDWTVRGALTQGDIASWILAGSYASRATGPHRYDLGVTYSTQRYDGGNPASVVSIRSAGRTAGSLYAFDTWSLASRVAVTYGGRYTRFDYLTGHGLVSPRVALTVAPTPRTRVSTVLSRRALAPGAEEFMTPSDGGVWLPPQRTFSELNVGRPLEAERASHFEIEAEHDVFGSTTLTARAFRQQVSDQLSTLFGVRLPDGPSTDLGHYFVATAGDVNAAGWGVGLRTVLGSRFNGSVDYSMSHAQWGPADDLGYMVLFAPSATRFRPERIHDVSAAFEARVPETSTRVLVLYRLSNAFAKGDAQQPLPGLDSRFDVQVRQSLPFMNFSNAQWEMLIAVRNFFHEIAPDQSIYDELLVVRPPKRVVGGLTLRF